MEPEKSFKELIFDLLHDSQKELHYRMLTSSKREIAERVEKIHLKLMEEYTVQAIDATEQSWLEAEVIEPKGVNFPDMVVVPEIPKEEKMSFRERWFGKKR